MVTFPQAPCISVIIPSYNCDRYIAQAIESVLAQGDSDVEIIVIDDGSQDNTQSVVQPYQGQIQYCYQTNQGVAVARNRGIQMAQGEFVAFLDADDVFLPDKLACQLAVFKANPDLGIVHSGWRRITQTGEPLMDVEPWKNVPVLDLESWLRWKPLGTMGTLMFRRDWLQQVGGFEPGLTHAEDVDLVLRLSLAGCQADWLRQPTVCYRQHEQNTMRNGLAQARSINWVLDRFFQHSDLPLEIQLMKNWVRYSTLVWCSWNLYYTGFLPEMQQYLQKSWEYTPFPPVETVMNWVESFTKYSEDLGEVLDGYELCCQPEWQSLTEEVIGQFING
ncbi:MAG: glycosyltransferase [Oscillatoriales cyanobacterium RM2_1_1]|nr:glycosyltransferase [Oscillatoriales cyanobacterium SM2_3_0]NJO46386.1 glycosyltransferase [Oscillatoriales cyanobacterium RM2_1_1]